MCRSIITLIVSVEYVYLRTFFFETEGAQLTFELRLLTYGEVNQTANHLIVHALNSPSRLALICPLMVNSCNQLSYLTRFPLLCSPVIHGPLF